MITHYNNPISATDIEFKGCQVSKPLARVALFSNFCKLLESVFFCRLFKKCIIKTIIELGLRMISRSIKPRDFVICLSLQPR